MLSLHADIVELAESGGLDAKRAGKNDAFTTKAPSQSARLKTDDLWKNLNADQKSRGGGAAKKKFSLAQLQRKSKKKRKRQHHWKDMFKKSKYKSSAESKASAFSAAEAAKRLIQNAAKSDVSKVVKFAGKKMSLTNASSTTQAAKPKKDEKSMPNSVDKILEAIQDPKKITTVEKSSYDWDRFKKEKGLDETFEKRAQNGYVSKKEFLNRVDWRKFESERKVREAERLKAMAETKK